MSVPVPALDIRQVRDRLGVTQRLTDAPTSATVRGVWFSMAADYVRKLGRPELAAWQRMVAHRRRLPFLSYSLREYLDELSTAAAIVDPKEPTEGLRLIWREAVPEYVRTPFGRSLLRLLKVDPTKYMTWLTNHHDHFCNFGKWDLVRHAEGYVTMEMKGEYVWIEHAQRGGAEGLLGAFGVDGSVEPEMLGPYEGRLHIRWRPTN